MHVKKVLLLSYCTLQNNIHVLLTQFLQNLILSQEYLLKMKTSTSFGTCKSIYVEQLIYNIFPSQGDWVKWGLTPLFSVKVQQIIILNS